MSTSRRQLLAGAALFAPVLPSSAFAAAPALEVWKNGGCALRLEIGAFARLGPGKIQLLETIAQKGSIPSAAHTMGMSDQRASYLADSLNQAFRQPVVTTPEDGQAAELTDFGRKLIERYRAMEDKALRAIGEDLAALETELRDTPNPALTSGFKPTPAEKAPCENS
jgi:molybdate transport system regulatory protein